jgi:hypothetical protein
MSWIYRVFHWRFGIFQKPNLKRYESPRPTCTLPRLAAEEIKALSARGVAETRQMRPRRMEETEELTASQVIEAIKIVGMAVKTGKLRL